MASQHPSSSWHPAHMPNHEEPASFDSPTSLHNDTSLEPKGLAVDVTGDDDTSAWLNEDDNEHQEGGAWLESTQPHPLVDTQDQQHVATPQTDLPSSRPAEVASAAVGDSSQNATSSSHVGHASSMSFARTASQFSFQDDDDNGEWNISRADTDHFRFMPLSDRSNSFPSVPKRSPNENHDSESDSPDRTLDNAEKPEEEIVEGHSRQTQTPHQYFEQSPSMDSEQCDDQYALSPPMGGEVQGFQGQAADARYEEGVPLISHQPQTRNVEKDTNPFGSDEAGGDENDDFFGQVNSTAALDTPPSHFDAPALERKSTEQVLCAFANESTLNDGNATPVATPADDENIEAVQEYPEEEINAKWQEAFGDDDEDGGFLLDGNADGNEVVDHAGFLGSDDEGFLGSDDGELLDDLEDAGSGSQAPSGQASGSNPYVPRTTERQPPRDQSQNPTGYIPTQALPINPTPTPYNAPAPPNLYNAVSSFGSKPSMPGLGQTETKAQSFADKSRGGYSSPYDLPSDIASSVPKPRKRTSMQTLYAPGGQPAPPPARSTSMFASQPPAGHSRPNSQDGPPAMPLNQKASIPVLRSKSSFFEELPMQPKVRPASRHNTITPTPGQYAPQGIPAPPSSTLAQTTPAPPLTQSMIPPLAPVTTTQYIPGSSPLGPPMGGEQATPAAQQPPAPTQTTQPQQTPYGNLVAPERVSPYASLHSSAPLPTPSASSRYSPSPNQPSQGGVPLAPTHSRYSPAPAPRTTSGYSPNRGTSVTPPVLPHLPRTSSPLAHFESRNAAIDSHIGHGPERRASSSSYEPKLVRAPSLAPTREVDEEDEQFGQGVSLNEHHSGSDHEAPIQHTPPPAPTSGVSTLPTKQTSSNYAPHPPIAGQAGFVPPPRAQTQSPSAVYGNKKVPQRSGSVPRPSTGYSPTSPLLQKPTQSSYAPTTRGRGASLTLNMVPPTDGREMDPLERWKGVPIIAWGVGGTLVTSFPKSIPRYSMGSSIPTVTRVPGEVKVKSIKDVNPLSENVSSFPGPLKGKSKKKETISWLTSGIESLEKDLSDASFHSALSLDSKRSFERLLLWKILRVFIEHDGTLEGTPAVEKAVQEILSLGTGETSYNSGFTNDPRALANTNPITHMQTDAVDSPSMEQIRQSLLKGERESAIWLAVDKRLWGHALLIANTVSPTLYKQVAQEFVRKEVNHPGHVNESLGALYMILSGNHDDCVDELVPSHARAGFQLISTDTTGPTNSTLDGLDKWRDTLTLVLSNRSADDGRGLNSLGNLLAQFGRAEAAHICFLFSRSVSIFGGVDDPNVNFVLLGSDHRQQVKEAEALQLSEVYEYGLTLAGGCPGGAAHLAAYKLQHAATLAEYGYREKAMQYLDAIGTAISSQTKRSPYYTPVLVGAVDDFMTRLKQAPTGESTSWISKPSMNKVSDSMWNKFNKFVAGENGDGKEGEAGENGPFARIGTPTISRSPSVNNFEIYGSSAPNFGKTAYAPVSITAGGSKYAPVGAQSHGLGSPYEPVLSTSAPSPYAPISNNSQSRYAPCSHEPSQQLTSHPRSSGEYPGYGDDSQEPLHGSAAPGQNAYAPLCMSPGPHNSAFNDGASSEVQTTPAIEATQPQTPVYGGYQPYGLQESASMPALSSSHTQNLNQGYEAPQAASAPTPEDATNEEGGSGGYEPPSYQPYGYEPPSYQPDMDESPAVGDDGPKPKKKSFMDDDFDDDIPALKAKVAETSKAEKDRENEEMFRKAAEEDAKRAAEQANAKKGWGFGGWFGKRAESPKPGEQAPKAVKAKLGETSSFVYDTDLKRWINKKPGAENVEKKTATPPPPRAGGTSTPPPMSGTPPPSGRSVSGTLPPRSMTSMPILKQAQSVECLSGTPPMARSASGNSTSGLPPLARPLGGTSAPPSRPTTSMSNASSIDDLLGAPGPRKGAKKPRKSGRYVDVMANN